MNPDRTALEAGHAVGRFTIESELDRGGFGVVYRARDEDGNAVALKVLHPDLTQDEEIIRRFEREIRVVTLIAHPNVVRIFDVGATEDGTPFFAMELLQGIDLKQHIQSYGRYVPEEMLKILEPLGEALSASHKKGVIHRDLKPSNVFLGDRVVLLDFGIAKLLEETGGKITSSRHVVGTPPSMAPEQITGGTIDERTDVYALGALVFYKLCGRMPFVHHNVAQLLDLQLRAPAPIVSRFAPVSAAIDRAVARALAKDPDERQETVAKFVAQIRAAISGSGELDDTPLANRVANITAVHVEIRHDGTELAALDDDALDELEAVLPEISEVFTDTGFRQSSRSGTSVLLLHPECSAEDAMTMAEKALEKHVGRGLAVHVHVTVGPIQALPEVASWVPEISKPGVHIV